MDFEESFFTYEPVYTREGESNLAAAKGPPDPITVAENKTMEVLSKNYRNMGTIPSELLERSIFPHLNPEILAAAIHIDYLYPDNLNPKTFDEGYREIKKFFPRSDDVALKSEIFRYIVLLRELISDSN